MHRESNCDFQKRELVMDGDPIERDEWRDWRRGGEDCGGDQSGASSCRTIQPGGPIREPGRNKEARREYRNQK
jgi:hypothetical protein